MAKRQPTYGAGYDGIAQAECAHPFDMEKIQANAASGSRTSYRIGCFGNDSQSGISQQTVPMEGVTGTDGKNSVEIFAIWVNFESYDLSPTTQNLHRLGTAKASDVWLCILQGPIVPWLMKKLYEGPIDKIIISTLAFLTTDGESKPKVVQTMEFTGCFVKFVDPISHGAFAIVSFCFTKVKITTTGYGLNPGGDLNQQPGQSCYEYDFSDAHGIYNG